VGTESRACYELAQKRLTNAENLNKVIERADERTRTADLLITRMNRYISGCMRLLQNPIGKPNTRTSNIREQPEMGSGWCTNGVQKSQTSPWKRHTFLYLPRMKSWPQTLARGMLVDL
jgi:hypothetical protein